MFESLVDFVMVEHLYGAVFDPPIDRMGYARILNTARKPYATSDGYYLAVLPYTDENWRSFFRIAGREALMEDPCFASVSTRVAHSQKIYGLLEEFISTRTAKLWQRDLDAAQVPVMVVNTKEMLLENEQVNATGFWRMVEHPSEGRPRGWVNKALKSWPRRAIHRSRRRRSSPREQAFALDRPMSRRASRNVELTQEQGVRDMTNPMSLQGRNIIVTGAGQGIGEAIARLVVQLGGRAILVDAQGDKVKALAAALGDAHAQAHVGSVADPSFVQAMVARAVADNGTIHGLVNNAGIVRAAMINKMSADTWQQVIDVNLSGVFYFLQAVGRHMLERLESGSTEPASIVNISSDAGRRGTIGQINYGAAKAGVLGITMSAAREWGAKGIRVNSVCFGVVETEMTETVRSEKFRDRFIAQVPMGRFSTPEEVSQPVCFLLSQAASYVTGQHLSVNGGYTIGV